MNTIADASLAAALHTLSRIRALLDRYEAALSSGNPIHAHGIGEALYRKALNASMSALSEAYNAELAGVPLSAPPLPSVTHQAAPKEDLRRWGD